MAVRIKKEDAIGKKGSKGEERDRRHDKKKGATFRDKKRGERQYSKKRVSKNMSLVNL